MGRESPLAGLDGTETARALNEGRRERLEARQGALTARRRAVSTAAKKAVADAVTAVPGQLPSWWTASTRAPVSRARVTRGSMAAVTTA